MPKQLSARSKQTLQKFLDHKRNLDARAAKGPFGYIEDFAKLRQRTTQYKDDDMFKAEEGAKPHNYRKNRYKDILPYDYSRVVLSQKNDILGTDYINANYISGYKGSTAYVAAQGPLPNTVNDFWRMLWEQKPEVVIMACNEYEGDLRKHKCQRYWAESISETAQFEDVEVSLEEEISSDLKDYSIRRLRVCCQKSVHRLHQIHYKTWPDHGVPGDLHTIIEMLKRADELQKGHKCPLVIHCSAGCGRTGTLIVVDTVLRMIQDQAIPSDFDLFSIIDEIRKQRTSMVQSQDQYKFVFDVIEEVFTQTLKECENQSPTDTTYANEAFPTPNQKNECEYEDVSNVAPIPVKRSPGPRPAPPSKKGASLPDVISGSTNQVLASSSSREETFSRNASTNVKAEYVETGSANAYAYADPDGADRWSFQHIARGETVSGEKIQRSESDYQEVDDLQRGSIESDNSFEYADQEDENAPPIPRKNLAPSRNIPDQGTIGRKDGLQKFKEIFKKKNSNHDGETRPIVYQGLQVGYPHRVGKPKGKRETMIKVH